MPTIRRADQVTDPQASRWQIELDSTGTDFHELAADWVHQDAMAVVIEAKVQGWLDLRGTSDAPPNVAATRMPAYSHLTFVSGDHIGQFRSEMHWSRRADRPARTALPEAGFGGRRW